MAQLTLEAKKEWAQFLYVENKLTQKEIASKVGVSQKTIGEWKEKYLWENLRRSLLITRKEQLTMIYNQLDAITRNIRDKQDGIPTSRDSDSIMKLTASIKNLETDLSVADVFETGKRFITWIQAIDYEKSKEIVDYFDGLFKE